MYLEKINGPEDVKKLDLKELQALAREIRTALLNKLSIHGGHVGPNLGDIELTIALHCVFHSPIDKFVFDVSHQTYAHKMLTGRKDAFLDPEKYDDVTGFSEPKESKHDFFTMGHTSTSVSLAAGLCKARDQLGGKENIIAIIGDGSLSGGEALEGLDFAADQKSNFIIVVNDNDMSIAENHGGIYHNLAKLRETNGTYPNNLFKAIGFDYVYVDKGNDIASLIDVFGKVKDIDHPIVVHVHTVKGYGYSFAEKDKERFHYSGPFYLDTGKLRHPQTGENYAEITYDFLSQAAKADKRVVILTSAVPGVINATPKRRKELDGQFVDDDIAEENATAFASGIAKGGAIPFYPTVASFMQRTYDQISQDVCINDNPVNFIVFGAGIFGGKDVTHLGIFDIPFLSNIPNLVYLAPYTKEEYDQMLAYALKGHRHPLAIRVPSQVIHGPKDTTDYSIPNRSKVIKKGDSPIVLIAVSSLLTTALAVEAEMAKKSIHITVIDPVFLTGLDQDLLIGLVKEGHDKFITLEDSVLDGGYGQKVASFLSPMGVKVINRGIAKAFIDRFDRDKVLAESGLTKETILKAIED